MPTSRRLRPAVECDGGATRPADEPYCIPPLVDQETPEMMSVSAIVTLALALSAGAPPGHAADERGKSDVESADALFKSGQLAEAGKLYARVAAGDPRQYQAALRLGYLALLSNRFDEARKW